ncbi:tyrosyl-DNA phosphodiesterase domain-containing protein [Apiospora saccharicola]|uniref:Tyrosyl-DNA phosphodiesterase domain-containing protein n=1 Tax=Apiospora saccharicola TaxID=335842 RepID=A0ABR1USB2_9PEZI
MGESSPPNPSKVARGHPSAPALAMSYPNGGLRITRTPGRRDAKNCVSLGDLIDKEHMVSACIFAFYIADEELFPHLPLSVRTKDAITIYIGRDANNDPLLQAAAARARISLPEGKLTKKTLDVLRPHLDALHKTTHQNLHSFYAWAPGSAHSKLLLLVYPTFLRIVITSCNMMDIDTVLGDNHWYIHDVPQRTELATRPPAGFEGTLLTHLEALGTPAVFLDLIRGSYDYGSLKVYLVTSHPGTFAGPGKAEQYGLLRLRKVVKHLGLGLGEGEDKSENDNDEKVRLDICTASVGNIAARWLTAFHQCALGRQEIGVVPPEEEEEENEDELAEKMRLFYPSVDDVRTASADSPDAASNIGCHLRPWDKAPQDVKRIFHHYRSQDAGRLFHQKLIMAYDPVKPETIPHYLYIGSANLSQSAWGGLAADKKKGGNPATCDTKLTGVSNFECGVVIPGRVIEGLLEPGTEAWEEGVVPFDRTAGAYDLEKGDRPWNDPRWVKGYRHDYDAPL